MNHEHNVTELDTMDTAEPRVIFYKPLHELVYHTQAMTYEDALVLLAAVIGKYNIIIEAPKEEDRIAMLNALIPEIREDLTAMILEEKQHLMDTTQTAGLMKGPLLTDPQARYKDISTFPEILNEFDKYYLILDEAKYEEDVLGLVDVYAQGIAYWTTVYLTDAPAETWWTDVMVNRLSKCSKKEVPYVLGETIFVSISNLGEPNSVSINTDYAPNIDREVEFVQHLRFADDPCTYMDRKYADHK